MSVNPYIGAKRASYAAVASTIEGIQTRAANEDRDLTAEELRSIKDQSETAKTIAAELEMLTEQHNRTASVAEMAVKLNAGAPASGNTSASNRDPGHYRSASQGGQRSFFADMQASKNGDAGAEARIAEHQQFMRAETTASLPGVIPPHWMTEMYTKRMQQDAALYNSARKVSIPDARPFQLPGQTAFTTVATQASENAALVDGDAYNAAAVTVTPTTIVARETVSRQLLDAGNPAIDALLLDDLVRSYVADRENRIGAAIRAANTPVTGTLANFTTATNAGFAHKLYVNAQIAIRSQLFERPDALAVDYETLGELIKLADTTGRPLVTMPGGVPQNVDGIASPLNDGWMSGLPLVVSAGIKAPSSALYWSAIYKGEYVQVFESPNVTFRYEEVAGPQSIQLGLWRYFAVSVRQGSRAVQVISIT